MTTPKILIADSISPSGIEELTRDGALEVSTQTGLSEGALVEIIPQFSGIVVRSQTKVTAAVVNAGAQLRVIGRAGVGIDNVDLDAATRRGVIVMNAPGGNTISTAEHAFSLLLCVARKIPQADAMLRAGKWDRKNLEGVELFNKTLGIVGLGTIGKKVTRLARAFGMRVQYFDIARLSEDEADALGVRFRLLRELIRTSDVVSLHVPLNESTRHMIGAEELALMKPTAIIVNTSRGPVIDEKALTATLSAGKIFGAGLDVFDREPPPADNPLLKLDNVVLTAHFAGPTWDNHVARFRNAFDNVQRVARGEPALWVVPELAE
jgi:D-3-phosphoglycerate dehydrogenase